MSCNAEELAGSNFSDRAYARPEAGSGAFPRWGMGTRVFGDFMHSLSKSESFCPVPELSSIDHETRQSP
jgi:hypothetical protein